MTVRALLKSFVALLWGAILGTSSVLLHNAFSPMGPAIVLAGTGMGIWLIGRTFGKRIFAVFASVGWILIVIRAATAGVGGELLVEGNFAGKALIVGGSLTLIVALFAMSY